MGRFFWGFFWFCLFVYLVLFGFLWFLLLGWFFGVFWSEMEFIVAMELLDLVQDFREV